MFRDSKGKPCRRIYFFSPLAFPTVLLQSTPRPIRGRGAFLTNGPRSLRPFAFTVGKGTPNTTSFGRPLNYFETNGTGAKQNGSQASILRQVLCYLQVSKLQFAPKMKFKRAHRLRSGISFWWFHVAAGRNSRGNLQFAHLPLVEWHLPHLLIPITTGKVWLKNLNFVKPCWS